MKNSTISPTDIPLLILGDDDVAALARELSTRGQKMAVVGGDHRSVTEFMVGRRSGYTVALVADVDDPIQLSSAASSPGWGR
ncbi:hypothetical protein [Gordonia humi]|uniref:Putative methyltransferase n=1 Tax=Gordonia humi TaxID=686429 RepID=A0A840EZH7_9ACTN|nr:hypothetical protein [Gordonia humi]MBB4134419.1 putative methyltransferase [Gordonia humi]